jgi:hypothetical protein
VEVLGHLTNLACVAVLAAYSIALVRAVLRRDGRATAVEPTVRT